MGDLSFPVNIAFNNDTLYVVELYGKLKEILPNGEVKIIAQDLLNYKPDFKIPGTGESGVIGIVIEPESGEIFLSMVYLEQDQPKAKVVRIDPKTGTQKIIIDNILSVLAAHQIQALTIGPDKKLYVNLGDGLVDKNVAQDDKDYRGKILQMNLDGSDVKIFAKGFRNPFGARWRKSDQKLYITDNGPSQDDRIAIVEEDKNYGWPRSMRENSLFWWNYTQGVTALDFSDNQFGENFQDEMFVALIGASYAEGRGLKGKRIIKMKINAEKNGLKSYDDFAVYIGNGPSTPCALAFGKDGLYFSDLYGESGLQANSGKIYKIIKK